MTATEIARFRNKEPGRGTIFSGIYNILLDGYVNGTGFTLDAAQFGVSKLEQLLIQPVDCAGAYTFDWDPSTEVLTIFSVGTTPAEIANDAADGDNIRVMYWGF